MSQARSRTLKALRLAALAAIGATVLGVSPVWANPITNWTYHITSKFDTGSTTYSSGGCDSNNTTHQYKLAWGCEDNSKNKRSSLVIGPHQGSGSITTNAAADATPVVLTHNNFVITGSHLLTTTLKNTITFTPSFGGPVSLDLGINFTETPNSGTCVVQDGGPKCSDIFVISNTTPPPTYTDLDGNLYTLFFGMIGVNGTTVGNLLPDECAAAGASTGCFGFTTKEGQSNSLAFTLAITGPSGGGGTPVPEPGVLGMMGFGLFSILGLLFLRHRRTAEDKVD